MQKKLRDRLSAHNAGAGGLMPGRQREPSRVLSAAHNNRGDSSLQRHDFLRQVLTRSRSAHRLSAGHGLSSLLSFLMHQRLLAKSPRHRRKAVAPIFVEALESRLFMAADYTWAPFASFTGGGNKGTGAQPQ